MIRNKHDVVEEFILSNYPQGVYADYALLSETNNEINLSCVVPRTIIDDKKKTQHIKFLKFEKLGKIRLSASNKIEFCTSKDIVKSRIKEQQGRNYE